MDQFTASCEKVQGDLRIAIAERKEERPGRLLMLKAESSTAVAYLHRRPDFRDALQAAHDLPKLLYELPKELSPQVNCSA